MVGEEFGLYGSESKSCVFKLFDGIKISVVTFEPFWPVEFFQGGIEAFRQGACNRVCVGGYSELSFVCGEAEFLQRGDSSSGCTGEIGCLETYAVCIDEGI